MKTKSIKRTLVLVLAMALIITAMIPIKSMAGNDLEKNDLTVLKTVVNKDKVDDPYEAYRFQLELTQPESEDTPEPEKVNRPYVITGDVQSITENSVTIVNNGHEDFRDIIECGVQYSTDPYLKEGVKNVVANGIDTSFRVDISDLQHDTSYYYRAYGIEKDGNKQFYGYIKHFKTPAKPIVYVPNVVTGDHSKDPETTADINSNTYSGFDNQYIFEVGIQYALDQYMTNSVRYKSSGAVVNPFNISLTGLNSNTTYYYRAYVRTQYGMFYGDMKSLTTVKGSIVSSANWIDFGGKVYADTAEGDNIPVDMPISEFDRLSDTSSFPDLNLKKVDTGVYTFTLKDKQSLNVNGLEENVKFKVTELGGVTDGKDVDLIDQTKRCSSFLNDEQTSYPVTDGKMSAKMDSEFIYTFPGKDGTVLGADAGPDDTAVKGSSGNNSSVLGQEAKTADAMNMVPLMIIVGLIALFTIVIAVRKESN